ncbi:MAG: HAMP domain-containing histidine kinase [Clostridia bacterium]|nr:HAMP domain-containing histidine kinase [Clostridia bacterium]
MKSIRARLTTTVILIMCLCFVATSMGVFFSLGHIYKTSEGAALTDTAQRLSKMASGFMRKTDSNNIYYSNILEIIFRDDIRAYSRSRGYLIITVDKYNRIIYSSENSQNIIAQKGIPQSFLQSILNGNVHKTDKSLSEYYGIKVVTSAYPVYDESENIIGAVICSLPTGYLTRLRMASMGSIMLVMLPVLALSILVIYITSKTITNPITKISKAAKLIANGDLTQRVNVKSKNEIGELSDNFNMMAQALEHSDKMKNNFISDVSHELRTPMTTIIGFLQGISDGTIAENEQEKYIEICLNESRRLSRLVTQLLDIARMESNDNQIDFSVFDINEKIRQTVFKFKDSIEEKYIHIEVNLENDTEMVHAETDSIERVLNNLFDNAVKFTPEKGIIIISTSKKNKNVEITISNSGNGISDEEISHIWEKFYKTDKSRSMDKKGVGLGLYIVKKILANHGKSIYVLCENKKDKIFTTFKFNLNSAEKEITENGSKN